MRRMLLALLFWPALSGGAQDPARYAISSAQPTWQVTSGTAPLTIATPVTIKSAAGGARNYVSACQFTNTASAGVGVQLLDGATPMWSGWLPSKALIAPVFPTPLRGSAGTAISIKLAAASSVFWNCQGLLAP